MTPDHLSALARLVGPQGLVTADDARQAHERDWLGKWQGRAAAIVKPADTEACAAVLRWCSETRTPVVTQGGNTGMSGGATPDDSAAQLLLVTTRMNRIRAVDPVNNTLVAEAGVVLQQAQQAAAEVDRLLPLSLGAEGSCTIGGTVATNAGGTAVLRYGNMRDLVLGLEVVLPDGRIWHGLRGLRKDNTGYDLRGLFAGSEGTLGIVTAAVLKLWPATPARETAWIGADSLEALVHTLAEVRSACGERLVAFETLHDDALQLVLQHVADTRAPLAGSHRWHALVELSDTEAEGLAERLERALGAAIEAGRIDDVVLCRTEAQRQALWKLREGISQAQVRAGKAVKHDIALPISALAGFVAEAEPLVARLCPQGRLINFGHVGDGNLHFNVLLPLDTPYEAYAATTATLNRAVHERVVAHGGSISAEHGIGQLRRDELRHFKSPLEMELMDRIKRALDPNHLLNPGKLL